MSAATATPSRVFIRTNNLITPTRCGRCGEIFDPHAPYVPVVGDPNEQQMVCDKCADTLTFAGFSLCLTIFNELAFNVARGSPQAAGKLLETIRLALDEATGIDLRMWP
jgi:hypothetical protein